MYNFTYGKFSKLQIYKMFYHYHFPHKPPHLARTLVKNIRL